MHCSLRFVSKVSPVLLTLLNLILATTSALAEGKLGDDGSIDWVERPESIAHPERWRFIPDERIPEGDIFDRFLTTTFISPFIFRDADVGTGFGLAAVDIDFRDNRRREFFGLFTSITTEEQQEYTTIWRRYLEHEEVEGGILQEERNQVFTLLRYERVFTRRFFGLGSDTNEADETSYSDEAYLARVSIQHTLGGHNSNWVGRAELTGEKHRLFRGRVSDAGNTEEDFPELFEQAQDTTLGSLHTSIRYDTRDSQHNPYKGWHLGTFANWAFYQDGDGQDLSDQAVIYGIAGGAVLPVASLVNAKNKNKHKEENPPTDALAFHSEVQYSAGTLPFNARPSLGGSTRLRGYFPGRYTGDSSWYAGSEWRTWLLPRGLKVSDRYQIERIGLALFAEVGAVSDEQNKLFSQDIGYSYGPSLRFTLERHAPFRVDFAFSDEDFQVTARFGNNF